MNEIYHIYNRGVDKRIIFSSSEEYSYFVHILYALNDLNTTNNNKRLHTKNINQDINKFNEGSWTPFICEKERDKLVDVLAFVLMHNHYHLLLRERKENGISKFMHKIGTAYTLYFNNKHDRTGSLFQGKYKRVHIQNDNQLLYIPHYIHLNPIKEKSFSTQKAKIQYLENFKWSSYVDYVGGKNFSSVTQREYILSLFGDETGYKKDILLFVYDKKKFDLIETEERLEY
jgi:putative transposase